MAKPTFIPRIEDYLIKELRPELKLLLNPTGLITEAFCKKFLELLPSDKKVMKENNLKHAGDSVDYLAWGYALTGNWEELEEEGRDVWNAIYEYGLDDSDE